MRACAELRVMVKVRLGSDTGLDEGHWLGVAMVVALLHLLLHTDHASLPTSAEANL